MGVRWIVDANNVVGSRPDGWWRDRTGAVLRLIDEVVRWSEATGERAVLVVDGHPSDRLPEQPFHGVDIRFARSSARDAADDTIVEMAEDAADRDTLRVVTSDRDLRRRVQRFGAETEGARGFLDRLADIDERRADRRILAHFGIDESALLGRGGEARVFAIDAERVLRLPHRGVRAATLEDRRALLTAIATGDLAVPEVLEHREVEGRTVVVERRLRGRNAADALADARDRPALIRDHLEVASRIAALPCPTERFGEIWGDFALGSGSFREWAIARLETSLHVGGGAFGHIDPTELTDDLVDALPEPEPSAPKLVHLDAFLGNMLAEQDRITAVLDFGPMTIGGPAHLDPLVSVAYLAPEITGTATADDRATARMWASERGLLDALDAAERWAAAYWTGAPDDQRLRKWCSRILLGTG